MEKILRWLIAKENIQTIKRIGQIVVFGIIILLILFFCSLITAQLLQLQTIMYSICFLCALLVLMVISSGLEISFGDLFKIKKDTEEIKKDMAGLKVLFKANQNQSNYFDLKGLVDKYYEPGETLDISDADETVFDGTN
jgi:small-conductance mechanosensitive channel